MEDFIEVIDSGRQYEVGETQSRSSLESDNLRHDAALDFLSEDVSAIPELSPVTQEAEKLKRWVVESIAGLGVLKELIAGDAYEEVSIQPIVSREGAELSPWSPLVKPTFPPSFTRAWCQ